MAEQYSAGLHWRPPGKTTEWDGWTIERGRAGASEAGAGAAQLKAGPTLGPVGLAGPSHTPPAMGATRSFKD